MEEDGGANVKDGTADRMQEKGARHKVSGRSSEGVRRERAAPVLRHTAAKTLRESAYVVALGRR